MHRKLFKLSGFLLPRISLLLFRQEKIEKTYTYVKAYRELLFEELKRVNKTK